MSLFLSPVQNRLLRSRRNVKARSPSSTGCVRSKYSVAPRFASGRNTTGTIFWILCGMFRYAVCDERYPGSPYAYGVRLPSRLEL